MSSVTTLTEVSPGWYELANARFLEDSVNQQVADEIIFFLLETR